MENAKSGIRITLEELVHPSYVVSIHEIAEDLGVQVIRDRLNYESLVDMAKDELKRVYVSVLAWNEYVSARRTVVNAVMKQNEAKNKSAVDRAKLKYITERQGARGSKSEADVHVSASGDFVEPEIKLANYDSYVQYLASLIKQLESLHNAIKDLLRDMPHEGR